MKKILITLIALASILFTSCFDPIYGTIRTDVKPEKPTVNGAINSIARFYVNGSEHLVLAANDGLRYKLDSSTSHGDWATYDGLPFETIHTNYESEPFLGRKIIKVVSDKTHLYIATVEFGKSGNPHSPIIYVGDENAWNKKTEWLPLKLPEENALHLFNIKVSDLNFVWGGFNIFSTNDPDVSNRKAYIRIGDPRIVFDQFSPEDKYKNYKEPVYFELNGTSTKASSVEVKSAFSNEESLKSYDPYVSGVNSVAIYEGNTYFFNTSAMTYYKQDLYIANGNTIYQGKLSPASNNTVNLITNKPVDIGSPVVSMAICSDAILVGCGNTSTGAVGGIKKVELLGGSLGGLKGFSNNAPIQMPSTYIVETLFNVDPSKKELESVLYSAITFPGIGMSSSNRVENIGLWSYYPSRGNWNRE